MRERYDMVLRLLVAIVVLGEVFGWSGNAQQIQKSSFSCEGRGNGYYADIASGCQVYHMCDGLGRQFSYTCPNATLFQQRMLICDHWYMVNCSRATADYDANLLIGQRNKPFVEDSEMNPYARTPRPDLLDAPSNLTEYNIVYRTGEQNLSPRDYVGVESDENSTDQPTYFPPSHWSTEISKQKTTPKPSSPNFQRSQSQNGFQRRGSQFSQGDRTPQSQEEEVHPTNYRTRGKAIDINSPNKNKNNNFINFKSNFKATTPVYPEIVEDTTRTPDNIGLLPPIPHSLEKSDYLHNELILELLPPKTDEVGAFRQNNNGNAFKVNFPSTYKATTPVYPSEEELNANHQEPKVNFKSNYKATTPVYPNSVEPTSPDPNQLGISPPKPKTVNFQSGFRATTPQYPTSVDPTSPDPSEAGLLPPRDGSANVRVNYESRFKATTPNYPTYVDQTSPNPSDAGILPPKESSRDGIVNYESNFKATTPNYPSYVDPTSPDPGEAGVLPPRENLQVNFESRYKATTPQYPNYVDPTSPNPNVVGLLPPKQKVAYKSRFKATTPKYPSFVEASSPNPIDVGLVPPDDTVVNFHSDYKATTPNYPTHVDATSPEPVAVGLLAPQPPNLVGLIEPNQKTRDTIDLPAKFYQPPILDTDYTVAEEDLQEIPGIRLLNFMKSFNSEQWQELRQAFRIPEYDFPLDDATRPSYNSVVNSFEPVANKK